MIGQSGGIGFSFFDHGRAKELSFRYIVTTGNEACLETLDIAEYVLDEGKTDALLMGALQFVADDTVDAPIPGAPYTFGVLKQAQALGDLQSLEHHARRVIRLHLGADIGEALREVERAVDAANLT